jgi:hypothetical protein
MFRLFIVTYLVTQLAAIAGKSHNPVLLYVGIGIAFWYFVLRFPVYPIKNDSQDVEN